MKSQVIKAEHFSASWYHDREAEFRAYNRKMWEFCAIVQVATDELPTTYNRTVLGFGVGREAIPAWFARRGALVVATDRPDDTKQWSETNQHSKDLKDLEYPLMLPNNEFHQQVFFRAADMNNIPLGLKGGQYDFVWSCGSLEHLGSLEHGLKFICEAMKCLKPGGIAAHTTELNIDPEGQTLESPDLSLYQQHHLDVELRQRLRSQGDELFPIDFTLGESYVDRYVDKFPYGNYHLKLDINEEYTTTSILLVAKRGGFTMPATP